METYTKFNTLEWKGKLYDLYVDVRGDFVATEQGEDPRVYSNRLAGTNTYEELVVKVKQKTREQAATVRVPFTEISRTYVVRSGFARGVHGKEHTTLVTYEDGEKAQQDRWATCTERLTGETLTRVEEAAATVREAQEQAARAVRWFEALVKPIRLDVRAAVNKAIDEKVRAEVAADTKSKETA